MRDGSVMKMMKGVADDDGEGDEAEESDGCNIEMEK